MEIEFAEGVYLFIDDDVIFINPRKPRVVEGAPQNDAHTRFIEPHLFRTQALSLAPGKLYKVFNRELILVKERPVLEVNAPIWVKFSERDEWRPRHFAKWGPEDTDLICAWDGGQTSHTTDKCTEWSIWTTEDPYKEDT